MKKIVSLLVALVFILSACSTAATLEPSQAPADETSSSETSLPTDEAGQAPEATEAPAESIAEYKELTIGTLDYFPIHGFAIDTDDAQSMVSWGVMETLVKIMPDGSVGPSLAETWSLVDDITWQFSLRKGITFTNGEPFNAEAVVQALNFIKSSPTPPRGISDKTFASIEALDENTVLIKTNEPDPLMPNRLTNGNTGILAPSAYPSENGPVDFMNTGTGPFILTDYVPEQSITLSKNPNYWGSGAKLDEVTVLYIPDGQVRSTMLQTGEIDLAIHLPISELPVLEGNPDFTLYHFQQPRTNTLYLNISRKPFDDIKVRQAVAYAIDKQLLVEAILEGVGSPAKGAFASYEGWTNPDVQGLPFDPEKAKSLLADAGYEPGALTVTILTYPGRTELPTLAVAIQDMLADVGINAEVKISQYTAIEGDVLAGNFDIFILSRSHVLESYDPQGFFAADYTCTGGYNVAHFCNEEFDTLLASTSSMTDINQRIDAYKQLQTMLDEQVASIFLNYTELVNGANNRVVNYAPYPLERFILTTDLDVK